MTRVSQAKQKLGEAFRVEQCPMFVIIDPEGNVVTTEVSLRLSRVHSLTILMLTCWVCVTHPSTLGGE
jgi:hypothetical protein